MDVRVGLWRRLSAENWWFWTVVLEKTLESPLDCKEIQPVHSEGDQPWDFFGRNDAKAETPVLWPPHAKSWLIGKDFHAGSDWAQEEKGTTEDEMVGWHHWLDGHEFEWTPGAGDGQGGLACCDSWGLKESDTTEWLNWTELTMLKPYTVWTTTNWKILKEMGVPDLLTCLLKSLYVCQKKAVTIRHRKTERFKSGKEAWQHLHCHSGYLTSI